MADITDPTINEGRLSAWNWDYHPMIVLMVCGRGWLVVSAYLEVRDDKSDTNWLLLDYESEKSDKLKLSKVGTGGLTELREALDDSQASYAYVRITYANDKESTRQKFILVVRHLPFFFFVVSWFAGSTNLFYVSFGKVWIGPNCKVMRRAKVKILNIQWFPPGRCVVPIEIHIELTFVVFFNRFPCTLPTSRTFYGCTPLKWQPARRMTWTRIQL